MTDLRLKLDDTDFERLALLGRSLIPSKAPSWTDHNAHDPGIMLIELVAWLADAQIYALGRSRRDERQAYARLLGLLPTGPVPAQGLVWPASGTWTAKTIVAPKHVLTTEQSPPLPFRVTSAIQLTRAKLAGVLAVSADGAQRDFSRSNAQPGASFMPFGAAPSGGERLVLQCQSLSASGGGVEPAFQETAATDAVISLGVHVVEAKGRGVSHPASTRRRGRSRLRVSIEDDDGARSLELVCDTTDGLLRSGVLLLRAPAGTVSRLGDFRIVVESASGTFLRPPRLQRVAFNVLPVEQTRAVSDSLSAFGNGLPDQAHTLIEAGLVDEARVPVVVKVFDGQWQEWRQVAAAALADCGPDEPVFCLDRPSGVVRFGNGINGALLPSGSALLVEYVVSVGNRGNLPAEIAFRVPGVAGSFGGTELPTQGGADATELSDLQHESRRRVRAARPLVTSRDLEQAARGFLDLEVVQARELPAQRGSLPGRRLLLAIGPAAVALDATPMSESPDWLEEIRARLAPRLPLGQRLEVRAPTFVEIRIEAKLLAAPRTDPRSLEKTVEKALQLRFSLAQNAKQDAGWPAQRGISLLALRGWLLRIPGVASVLEVKLFRDGVRVEQPVLALAPPTLAALKLEPGDITVQSASVGGQP